MSDSIIHTRGLTRTFGLTVGPRITVLKGIDLDIAEGSFVAIMGKSGAGKSTLLYQLSALDIPTSGTLMVAGQDIITMTEEEKTLFRLRTLGFIFQDYALIPDLTARENVMLPLLMRGSSWKSAAKTADAALTRVGLGHRITSLPTTLSGGEQQRVSIARAVAGTPQILFADEPTANLDTQSSHEIIALLSDLHTQGQTIVMVTHEAEYTASCDRIISMEDGAILNDTTSQTSAHVSKEE
jgi:putative ABC transport system ATP-binding protein